MAGTPENHWDVLMFCQTFTEEYYTKMKYCHWICAGTSTGSVNFLDLDTLRKTNSWKAHAAGINDMDARNNYLVTCGSSPRPYGPPGLDFFANVFDLRAMKQLPPIHFSGAAAFIQMYSKMSTTGVIASHTGRIQVIDLMNPNTINLHQANITHMLNLVLAPSGEAWAFTDQDCTIHLFGSRHKMQFTEYSNPVEFADERVALPIVDVNLDASVFLYLRSLPRVLTGHGLEF